MPSRTPLGTGSSSTSSSSSSSSAFTAPDLVSSSSSFLSSAPSSTPFPFISYSNNQNTRHPDFPVVHNTVTTSNVDPSGHLRGYGDVSGGIGVGGREEETPVRTGIGIRGRVESEERSSLSSSLSSSRDERVYTPIYPSYSSSFSNSSMELHQLLVQAEALQQQHYHHLRNLHQQPTQEPHIPDPSEANDDTFIPIRPSQEQDQVQVLGHPPSTHPRLGEIFGTQSIERHIGVGALAALSNLEDSTEATLETTRTPRTTVSTLQEGRFPAADPGPATSGQSVPPDHFMHIHAHDHGRTNELEEHMSFGQHSQLQQPHHLQHHHQLQQQQQQQQQHTALEHAHGPVPSFLDNNDSSNDRPDLRPRSRHGPLLLTQSIDMQPSVLSSTISPTALAFTPSSPSTPPYFPPFIPSGETFDSSDLSLPETTFGRVLADSDTVSSDPLLYTHDSSRFPGLINNDRPDRRSPYPYNSTDFDPSPYSTDTHLALSQVLATFQDTMEHTFPGQHSRSETQDVSSSSSGPLEDSALAYLSASVPEFEASHSRSPSGLVGLEGLVPLPQAFFPRRRYATRDYSTGSISSEDWLHHPEVVTLGETERQGSLLAREQEVLASSIPEPEFDPLGLREASTFPPSCKFWWSFLFANYIRGYLDHDGSSFSSLFADMNSYDRKHS